MTVVPMLAQQRAAPQVLWAVAITVTGVFLMIATGALARKRQWLSMSADATLLSLYIRLFLPALIFQQVVGNPALRSAANVLAPPVTAAVAICGAFALAAGLLWGLGRVARHPAGLDTPAKRRTFVLCTGVFNYGYVTIPLVQSLFPPELPGGGSDGTLGVLFVFNMGVEAALWGAGVMVLHGGITEGWWRRLLSPPLFATTLAILLNLLELRPATWPRWGQAPVEALTLVMNYLAVAAIPTGLLLTGATIWDDWRQTRLRQGAKTVVAASLLRLLILPALFILAAVALPLSLELRRILVLQAAMPAAVFPIVLARHYGGDVGVALRIVVGTSLLSLVTMPAWIALGLWLIG